MREATAYLEAWGRWASHGDIARQISLQPSTLRPKKSTHDGDEKAGIAVDEAISALGDDYKRLAILIYQHSLTNAEAMRTLGWSRMRFQKNLAAVKVAVIVANALAKKNRTG